MNADPEKYEITLPLWLWHPLRACHYVLHHWRVSAAILAVLGVLYLPWGWHTATTYRIAALCDEADYLRVKGDAWGCREDQGCTRREEAFAFYYQLRNEQLLAHCNIGDPPPTLHSAAFQLASGLPKMMNLKAVYDQPVEQDEQRLANR